MRNAFLKKTLAAGAVSALAVPFALASTAFAAPLVTGYQTGYSYHEGLANGSGGALMAAADSGSAASDANTASAASVTPAPAAPVSIAVPAAQPAPVAQAAAVEAAAVQPVAVTQAASPSLAGSITAAEWVGFALIALAVLIVIGMVVAALSPRRRIEPTGYRAYS